MHFLSALFAPPAPRPVLLRHRSPRALHAAFTLSLFSLLLGLLSPCARAEPRVWTSADGRTIQASYLGRATDGSALVLLRADTGVRVVVPLTSLSADDRAHAANLPTTAAPPPPEEQAATQREALKELAEKHPKTPLNPHSDVEEAVRRYTPHLNALGSGDPAHNARTLRTMIRRDLPVVAQGLAIQITPHDHYSIEGRRRIAKHTAAREIIAWLEALDLHAQKIETEAARINSP
jgi:hypothetical protein